MVTLKIIEDIVIVFMIGMIRLAALFSIAPFFSKQLITGSARDAIFCAFGIFVFPMVYPSFHPEVHLTLTAYVILFIKEVTIGVIMGYLSGFIFWVADCIGSIIDVQRGSSMASIMDPSFEVQTSLFGSFLLQIVLALFFTSGAFLLFLQVIFESYKIWPIFSFYPNFSHLFPVFFLNMTDELMRTTIILAGPIIFIMFLSEFGLGIISRFAPQLNVFFLAMPVKSILSVFFFVLYIPYMVTFFKMQFFSDNKMILFFKQFFHY